MDCLGVFVGRLEGVRGFLGPTGVDPFRFI